MIKLIITWSMLLMFFSCNSQVKTNNSSFQKLGSTFLDDLYDKRSRKCLDMMDDTVKTLAKDIDLESTFNTLSEKIRNDYGGPITSKLISSEKTFHENLPATFLIFKVESTKKFGYYFFYINDKILH